MNNQFKDIKARLQAERLHLTEELKLAISQIMIERHEGTPSGEEGETAAESFELQRQAALIQRMREHLAEVEHALEKLEKGAYGLCDCCGKPIPLARLEAIPQASLCVGCKANLAKMKLRA